MSPTPRVTAYGLLVATAAIVLAAGHTARSQPGPGDGLVRLDVGPDGKPYPDGHPIKALARELNLLGRETPLGRAAPGDGELKRLRKERYEAAQRVLRERFELFVAGSARGALDRLYEDLRLMTESESALAETPADQVAALQRQVVFAAGIQEMYRLQFAAGQLVTDQSSLTRYHRLDAEIKLLELKQKLGVPMK